MAQKPYTSDNKEVCGDMRGWGGGGRWRGLFFQTSLTGDLIERGGQLER